MNTPKNRALWSVIYRPAQGREQSASITVRHSLRDTQWFAEGFAEGVAAVIHGNVEYDPEVRPRDLPDDSHHLRVVDAVGDHFAHVF
ncbi:MAG: hypothetical protein J2P17_32975, partial [Mycobacterium sp.]|nr:hypothetical protein [Mycobacterium sp.]